MDNIYDSFLKATKYVFQMMLNISEVSKISEDSFEYAEGLKISIGVTGDYTGKVIYKFPQGTSLKLVNLMSGMDFDSIDEFVTSAVSEIANIISGNVVSLFASTNIKCDITPPMVGKVEENEDYDIESEFCVSSSAGELCFDIRLNNNSK